jgi:hypothetical protein
MIVYKIPTLSEQGTLYRRKVLPGENVLYTRGDGSEEANYY